MALRKSYLYKFYRANGTYITSIYDNDIQVVTHPTYTWTLNGGKGSISLFFGADIKTFYKNAFATNVPLIVKIYMHDKETASTGKLIYTGTLTDVAYTLSEEGFNVAENWLYISGERDLESKVVENVVTGATTISYSNMDIADIIKDLLDKYALKGGIVTYTSQSIQTVGLSISITVKNETYLGAIRRICGYLPQFWGFFIDGENVFNLKLTDLDTVDHVINIGKESISGDLRISYGDMVTTVFFHGGDTGGGTKLYKKYSNSVSQNIFGLYEQIISDERVTNTSTVDAKAEQILARKASPVRYLEATIMDSNGNGFGYDIDSIKPGDTIQIKYSEIPTDFTTWRNDTGSLGNFIWDVSPWDYGRAGLLGVPFQVQEITYEHDRARIVASDIVEDLSTTINQLEKRTQEIETINSPTTPS
jgi:hypothetical protein